MTEPTPDASGGITIAEAVERCGSDLRASRWSPQTARRWRAYIQLFVDHTAARGIESLCEVGQPELAEYWAELTARWHEKNRSPHSSPGYLTHHVWSVRRLFLWARLAGVVLVNPLEGERFKRKKDHVYEVLTREEVRRFLETPNTEKPTGLRDRAIFELVYSAGLRRPEVVRLDLVDVDLAARRAMIRAAKGKKDRTVPVGATAAEWMGRYLDEARPFLETDGAEPAYFLSSMGRRLTFAPLEAAFRAARQKAGITKRLTCHMLRHTCATHMIQEGADVRHVQELLGHESAKTTEVYTHVAIPDLAEAHEKFHPRGGRRDPREREK